MKNLHSIWKRAAFIVTILALALPAAADHKAGHGGGKGGGGDSGSTGSTLTGHLAPHLEAFIPLDPTLISRCAGAISRSYGIVWPRHDRCVGSAEYDPSGNLIVETTGVRPDGYIGREGKTLCNKDELCDDPSISVQKKGSRIEGVKLYIQDDIGGDGIGYESDSVLLDQPVQIDPCGFVLHVHKDVVAVWSTGKHKGAASEFSGYISIGDVVYQADPPCN